MLQVSRFKRKKYEIIHINYSVSACISVDFIIYPLIIIRSFSADIFSLDSITYLCNQQVTQLMPD